MGGGLPSGDTSARLLTIPLKNDPVEEFDLRGTQCGLFRFSNGRVSLRRRAEATIHRVAGNRHDRDTRRLLKLVR